MSEEMGIPDSHAPRRRFELVLRAGGDTREDLVGMVNHLFDCFDRGSKQGVTGGCSAGGWFQLLENPDMTNEKYFANIKEYDTKGVV